MRRNNLSIQFIAFFCLVFSSVVLAQSSPSGAATSPAVQPNQEVSNPALAAKAPGAPGYGLQITSSRGKIMITNLSYDPADKKAFFSVYRIEGPAGKGPYRCGMQIAFHATEPFQARKASGVGEAFDTSLNDYLYYGNYYVINTVVKGSAAEKAGLGKELPHLLSVDGSNFGWDTGALSYYITTHPVIQLETETFKIAFLGGDGPRRRTYKIQNDRLQTPPDPADGSFSSFPECSG